MNSRLPPSLAGDFRDAITGEVWERLPLVVSQSGPLRGGPKGAVETQNLVRSCMAAPLDFPAFEHAVVAGDHVALAVDPSVPQLETVLQGLCVWLEAAEVERVSVVLWAETPRAFCDQLRSAVSASFSGTATVCIHQPAERESLGYVTADEAGDPVYLARELVDADLIIPVLSCRSGDIDSSVDRSGLFPFLADASTLKRFQMQVASEDPALAWMLSVHVVIVCSSDASGNLAGLMVGTPDAVRQRMTDCLTDRERDGVQACPPADLVVAILDGPPEIQTWINAYRAIQAAKDNVDDSGTIVLWSQISASTPSHWSNTLGRIANPTDSNDEEVTPPSEDGFDNWSLEHFAARQLKPILEEHRVFAHGSMPFDELESLGMGQLENVEQLQRLAASHRSAGVLRAAHLHSRSVDRLASKSP
ncbi:MAG: hypothetical protein AAGD07_00460 [Planctomycetota bacterium]